MGKLSNDWSNAFQDSFNTDEEVIEFIISRINMDDFEDGYIQMGNEGNNGNTSFKYTAQEKREAVYDYLNYLIEEKDDLNENIKRLSDVVGSLVRTNNSQNKEIEKLKTELKQSIDLHISDENVFICESNFMSNSKWCNTHCEFSCPQEECYHKYFELTNK